MDLQEIPLPALFQEAQRILANDNPDEVERGCKILEQCEAMIDKLGLFSPNEDKEDISTGDLKYLLVPFYRGELTERESSSDRLHTVQVAKSHLKTFINSCERLGLVPSSELEAVIQEGPVNSEARRATKIARFKRLKTAESKLQELTERRERRKRFVLAAANSSSIEDGEEESLDEFGEEEREAWFTQISLALCKALDLIEMLKKEEELLSARNDEKLHEVLTQEMLDERSMKAEAWHRQAAMNSRTSKPPQPITCATFAQDVIEGRASMSETHQHKHLPLVFGPASLVGAPIMSERQRMAAEVFQPSHRLPTMSIEEAGLKEMEIMTKWTERNLELKEEANSSWVNADRRDGRDGSDDEDAEYKARAWDDWKDENPRGAGNKKLTPCG